MRLFLAIDLPGKVKQDLYRQLEPLRRKYRDMIWIPAKNYHISLLFFGNSDKGREMRLKEQIARAIYEVRPFHLYSADMDLFIRSNLTMYLGFQKNKTIENLVRKLKSEMSIVNDLKFFPHLTVARYRIPSKQQYLLIKKKFVRHEVDIQFPITQITLFDSVIENNKPVYKTVAEFNLES